MNRSPRVVIDARMASDGGIGTYLQQLVPRIARLRPEWRVTAIGDANKLRALGWTDVPSIAPIHSSAGIFSLREQVELPLVARGADLYWSPNYGIPVMTGAPLVVTIQDVNHLALPELMGGRLRRQYARWMFNTAVERARHLLFISQFTRDEAARLLASCSPGTVIRLGVDQSWFSARARAPEPPLRGPYFLYVGNIKRHKNVPFLLRAFERLTHLLPHRLVLVGRTVGLRADPAVPGEVARLGGRVIMLGEVDVNTLTGLVSHACALVTASVYEGFGLPALEAMAAGVPCVVSSAGSFPEICGDAALYGDPKDEKHFAARLLTVASDAAVRHRLIERGRIRAAQFSWDSTARETAAVLDTALLSSANRQAARRR